MYMHGFKNKTYTRQLWWRVVVSRNEEIFPVIIQYLCKFLIREKYHGYIYLPVSKNNLYLYR